MSDEDQKITSDQSATLTPDAPQSFFSELTNAAVSAAKPAKRRSARLGKGQRAAAPTPTSTSRQYRVSQPGLEPDTTLPTQPSVPGRADDAPVAIEPETWAEGQWDLGARFDAETNETTFAIFAPAAVRIELSIFPADIGSDATFSVALASGGDGLWRAKLGGLGHGTLYAYRAWGANWPYQDGWAPGSLTGFISDRDADGNHFNPNKVLLDPYATEVTHTPMSPRIVAAGADRGIFGTGAGQWHGKTRRELDTQRYAPKGIVIVDTTPTGDAPMRPAQDTAIYEGHVKNLTMHPSASKLGDLISNRMGFEDVVNVPAELRGTYAGAAYLAPYLRGLGINTIEFLPVHETDSDQIGAHNGTTNNWGYQTLNFFSPNRDYSSDKSAGGPTREFKNMVRTFHEQGIGVYIDVVFNHTAEGGNWDGDVDTAGFTSFGGLATTEYYDLTAEGFVQDGATGSSNQTNFSSMTMMKVVTDSLLHWHKDMGIDGFRFDLATVLGRFPAIFDQNDWGGRKRFFEGHPVLRRIAQLATENEFEVIAEAWDLWGYEVGNFPSQWGEWNGRFRDAIRRYLKGDANTRAFIEQFNGDWLHFNDKQGPQKSINFVTAHDGFTMMDLVSFNGKDNGQPFPFGPSDGGSDDNLSWDSGGDQALRRARWRNFWLVTFLARGVPMIVSGDEYGRSQNGNNNPWNLNSIGMWNNWAQAVSSAPSRLPVDPDNPELASYYDVVGEMESEDDVNALFWFARYVARLRALDPTLRQNTWGGGMMDDDDVSYLYYRPTFDAPPDGRDRQLGVLIDGETIGGSDYLVLVNMYDQPGTFTVPNNLDPEHPNLVWHRIIDTAPWAEAEKNVWLPKDAEVIEGTYTVEPWSIAVLVAASDESPLFTGPKLV